MTSRIASRLSALALALTLGAGISLAQAEPATPAAPDAPPAKAFPHRGFHQGFAHRDGGFGQPGQRPRSFTEDSVRKTDDGKVFKRHVEQKVGEGSFSRKVVLTNPEGKTATRSASATFDKDKQSWSRKEEGTGFDGKSWSRSEQGQGRPGPRGFGQRHAPADAPAKG